MLTQEIFFALYILFPNSEILDTKIIFEGTNQLETQNSCQKFGEKYVKAFYAIPATTKKTYFSCVPVAQE